MYLILPNHTINIYHLHLLWFIRARFYEVNILFTRMSDNPPKNNSHKNQLTQKSTYPSCDQSTEIFWSTHPIFWSTHPGVYQKLGWVVQEFGKSTNFYLGELVFGWVVLLPFTHPSMAWPLRFSLDYQHHRLLHLRRQWRQPKMMIEGIRAILH